MSALAAGEIETFGVPKEKILKVKVTTEDDLLAVRDRLKERKGMKA